MDTAGRRILCPLGVPGQQATRTRREGCSAGDHGVQGLGRGLRTVNRSESDLSASSGSSAIPPTEFPTSKLSYWYVHKHAFTQRTQFGTTGRLYYGLSRGLVHQIDRICVPQLMSAERATGDADGSGAVPSAVTRYAGGSRDSHGLGGWWRVVPSLAAIPRRVAVLRHCLPSFLPFPIIWRHLQGCPES